MTKSPRPPATAIEYVVNTQDIQDSGDLTSSSSTPASFEDPSIITRSTGEDSASVGNYEEPPEELIWARDELDPRALVEEYKYVGTQVPVP